MTVAVGWPHWRPPGRSRLKKWAAHQPQSVVVVALVVSHQPVAEATPARSRPVAVAAVVAAGVVRIWRTSRP